MNVIFVYLFIDFMFFWSLMLLWRKIKLTFTLKTTIIELVFYSIYKKVYYNLLMKLLNVFYKLIIKLLKKGRMDVHSGF
jgi:hypothetical protein